MRPRRTRGETTRTATRSRRGWHSVSTVTSSPSSRNRLRREPFQRSRTWSTSVRSSRAAVRPSVRARGGARAAGGACAGRLVPRVAPEHEHRPADPGDVRPRAARSGAAGRPGTLTGISEKDEPPAFAGGQGRGGGGQVGLQGAVRFTLSEAPVCVPSLTFALLKAIGMPAARLRPCLPAL